MIGFPLTISTGLCPPSNAWLVVDEKYCEPFWCDTFPVIRCLLGVCLDCPCPSGYPSSALISALASCDLCSVKIFYCENDFLSDLFWPPKLESCLSLLSSCTCAVVLFDVAAVVCSAPP